MPKPKVAKRKKTNKPGSTEVTVVLPDALFEITGTRDFNLSTRLITQVQDAIWFPASSSKDEITAQLQAAMTALRGIKPQDEIEGLLATQMISTHNAAMECLRRAMIPNQTFAGRDSNLKHAAKLLSIYTKQMETLNRNRGKGQQKMVVEHVNVEKGGQAIVGHIEQKPK